MGLQSSRLDAPDSISWLLGGSIDVIKPTLTAPAGLLSNGHEDPSYPAFANCVWSIAPASATRIMLSFSRFDIEKDFDYVYVYDGLSTSDPLLAKLTGVDVPPPVTSTRGAMLVVLKSDNAFATRGFEAEYRADTALAGFVPSWQDGAGVCKEATYRDRISFACRLCVLATVSTVCGENCVADHIHLVDNTKTLKLRPAPCLPALSLRLARAQTVRLGDALERSEPFGLSLSALQGTVTGEGDSLSPTDLYVPLPQEHLYGRPVYVGMDTGRYMVSCDPNEHPHLWVITAEDAHWNTPCTECEGAVWVDLATGAARTRVALPPSASVPFMVHTGLGECTGTLSSVLAIFAGALRLDNPIAAACWLMRFFGPQTSTARIAPTFIELDLLEYPTISLLSDLVVRGGQRLSIFCNDTSIVVGPRQVRVSPNAELRLDGVTIDSSTTSSAVLVEGRFIATNSTFRNCTARLNVLGQDGLDSQGGAVYVASGGELELHTAHVIDNAVRGGKGSTSGGGIFATGAKCTVVDSTLQHNIAQTAEGACSGGTIALVDGTVCELNNTRLTHNSVQGGMEAAGGAVYVARSFVRLITGAIKDNAAHTALLFARGGGLAVTDWSSIELADIEVVHNIAMDSADVHGGGVYMYKNSSIKLLRTTICGNAAKRSTGQAYGGGLYLGISCYAELRDVEVLNNVAMDSGTYAMGGGLFAQDETIVAMSTSVWRGNSASSAGR
jgi:hypothetical protein